MAFLLGFLSPTPHKPQIQDPVRVEKKYQSWRIRVFYSIYIGYVFYYLTRRCLAFAMPSLMTDLGYDKAQLGILTTTLTFAYGISKFGCGIIADQSNPRFFMGLGLMATGLCSIFFGLSSSLPFFVLFWAMNGLVQGCGWPSSTRLLTHWYSKSERGRWWSFFASSQNVGGALSPLIAAYCAQEFGWRMAMVVPGTFAILGGLFLINRLCDTPQSLGLPPIEQYRNDYGDERRQTQERELTTKQILFDYVLNNPYLWILGISYFFVYLIRQAVGDWAVLYLVETKGYSQLGAGAVLFWFEVGGVLGGLLAGWASDVLWSGNRGPVNVLFCLLNVGAIWAFKTNPLASPFVDSLLIFSIGFLLFGPLILIGIAGAELTHKKAAATATGFIGWISYLGAATAGYPLGCVTQRFGWQGFFITLAASALVTALILLPLWNAGRLPKKAPARLVSVLPHMPHLAFADEFFAEQAVPLVKPSPLLVCYEISRKGAQKMVPAIAKGLRACGILRRAPK